MLGKTTVEGVKKCAEEGQLTQVQLRQLNDFLTDYMELLDKHVAKYMPNTVVFNKMLAADNLRLTVRRLIK